jgi:integrase
MIKFYHNIGKYSISKGTRYAFKIFVDGKQICRYGYLTRREAYNAMMAFNVKEQSLTYGSAKIGFLSWYEKTVKPSTFYKYRKLIENHLRFDDDKKISSFDVYFLQSWFDSLDCSYEIKISSLLILKRLFEWCEIFHSIKNVSCRKVIIQKDYSIKELKEESVLSLDDFKRFYMSIDDPFWQDFFLLAFITGMRFGEMRGLTWNDFDFERNLVKVNKQATNACGTGKTEITSPKSMCSCRSYAIPSFLMNRFKEKKKKENKFVFSKKNGKSPVGSSTIYRALSEYQEKSGLERFKFHSFRKSEASFLNEIGISNNDIRDWLGHDSFEVTKKYYIKSSWDRKKEVSDALEQKLKDIF